MVEDATDSVEVSIWRNFINSAVTVGDYVQITHMICTVYKGVAGFSMTALSTVELSSIYAINLLQ